MKKILLTLSIIFLGLSVFATDKEDALAFFNNYVRAANTYSTSIPTMYATNAKIIRQVVKPDGTTVDINTDTATYIKQMKLSQSVAKMKGYSNSYSDITVTPIATGYKVSALRQPKGETYRLKMYQIIQKQPDGKWLIIEEMMQTKEQILLKYAKK